MLNGEDFRVALDHARDGVLIEKEDVVVYINPRYASILGYERPTDLVGAKIRDIADPNDCEILLEFGRRRERGEVAPERYTFRVRRRDGTSVLVSASVSCARHERETYITTIVRERWFAESLPVDQISLAAWSRLAPRELEIVQHLLTGQRPKEIAFALGISEKTVGTHRGRALQKLNLENDLELFRFGVRTGLIQP